MIKRADIYSLTKGTAMATDVASGKIAVVNGSIITGTAPALEPLTNNVTNGDFSNGTTSWTVYAGTLSASSNVLSVTGDGSDAASEAYQATGITCVNGHKIYAAALLKVTNTACQTLLLKKLGGSNGTFKTMNYPSNGTEYVYNGIITLTASDTGSLSIEMIQSYVSSGDANGKVLECKKVLAIDLTDEFGAGNEPATGAEMAAIIKYKYPSAQWFDGVG